MLNWFIFIFIDNAFYRKVTSCSDPFTHTDDAFVCFDVEKSAITEKTIIDCTIEENRDLNVICYIQNINIPVSLSIAYAFTKIVIIVLHSSFTITLWCVKKGTCGKISIFVIYVLAFCVYFVGLISYIVTSEKTSLKESSTFNYFYGQRMMNYATACWGAVTLLVICSCSPYLWLIGEKYYPSFLQHLPAAAPVIPTNQQNDEL